MSYNIDYYAEVDPMALSGGSKLYQEAQLARIKFASRYICSDDIVGDVCSGPPFASRIIQCKKYYGVDHPNLIESVRQKSTYPSNLEMIPYDFEKDDAKIILTEKADVIMSFETLEHTPDPESFLKNIWNILKPNGLLILSTPNNPYNEEPMSVEHFVEYSINEVVKMMEDAGFEIVKRKIMGVPLRWVMRQAKRMSVQTNRFDPENEERGKLSKLSDKVKPIRDFCNAIFSYKYLGVNWGNLGLNMVLVAKKVDLVDELSEP
jgi:SAM-dependent methyltransferase